MMDSDSGDDGTDELRQFGWEEGEKEWSGLGWRNEVFTEAINIQSNQIQFYLWHNASKNRYINVKCNNANSENELCYYI